jgi:signal transduction histidine kinase
MELLLDADQVVLARYEPGDEVTVVAHRGAIAKRVPPGTRLSHDGDNVQALVRRTARPGRIENLQLAEGTIAQLAWTVGARAVVGAPIVVDRRLWGVISASWNRDETPPIDTEERMAQFAQLLDTAIANADTHDQLMASRARLLTEADEARRRVVRDLHDGAQQRLVHTIVMLKLVQRSLREHDENAESLVGEALEHAERGNAELRELAHGLLPAALTRGGLGAGLDAVVMRLDLPVHIDVPAERFPAEIEASAYFIVAEALTNVVKHAHADRADVTASVRDGTLHVEVRDDGVGGADPGGHGLVGMGDRVTALGGRLKIETSDRGGTVVTATLPLPS